MKMQKYLAEMIGTFGLAFAVALSIISPFPLATPIVAGLTLGLFVYTVGPISGAHLNPAVTISLATVKKIKPSEAVLYIVFQLVGGILAFLLVGGETAVSSSSSWHIALFEAIGAFVLVWGVSSVVHENVKDCASGLVIGGSLLLGVMLTTGFSNGVLNPAVAVGIGSVSVSYLFAPVVGGVVSAWVYRWIKE